MTADKVLGYSRTDRDYYLIVRYFPCDSVKHSAKHLRLYRKQYVIALFNKLTFALAGLYSECRKCFELCRILVIRRNAYLHIR